MLSPGLSRSFIYVFLITSCLLITSVVEGNGNLKGARRSLQVDGYCDFLNKCDGTIEGVDWCSESQERCEEYCNGNWCPSILPPTSVTTLAPMSAPTLAPTSAPTLPLTSAPTLAPTSTPTLPPTSAPTSARWMDDSLFPLVKGIDYDSQMGTRKVDSGRSIGSFDNNDYLTYNSLNFGDAGVTNSILFSYSKGNADNRGQKMELRIGGPDGEIIGELSPSNTGGWFTYATARIGINDVTGINDLTLVGKGDGGILNIDYFELSSSMQITESPTLTPNKSPSKSPSRAPHPAQNVCCSQFFNVCNDNPWCQESEENCATCNGVFLPNLPLQCIPRFGICTDNEDGCCSPSTCVSDTIGTVKQCMFNP